MGMPGAGTAYQMMRQLAQSTDQRRAEKAYWQAVRARTPATCPKAARHHALPAAESGFPVSPRACPRCAGDCVILTVRGNPIDYCPACRRRWPVLEQSEEPATHASG